MNSDARDFVLPYGPRQAECIRLALDRAGLAPADITIINTHATGTRQGDVEECKALREVFADCSGTRINNTKSLIGHAMGAAGVLELAANLPAFTDNLSACDHQPGQSGSGLCASGACCRRTGGTCGCGYHP